MRTNRDQTLKAALYARLGSSDQDQIPETAFLLLREFVTAQGTELYREYVGQTSITVMARLYRRRQLRDEVRVQKSDLLLVWRVDPGFRSVLSAAATRLRPLDAQNPTPTGESD